MKINNVDYNILSGPLALAGFRAALQEVIAAKAGHGALPEHVALELSAGSVVVQAAVAAPNGDRGNIASALCAGKLARSVKAQLLNVPGVVEASTGPLSVTDVCVAGGMVEGSEDIYAPETSSAEVSRRSGEGLQDLHAGHNPLASAEVYDPALAAWVPLSSQVFSRRKTTLTSSGLTTSAAEGARCSPEFPDCANFQDGFELGSKLYTGDFGVVYKCTARHNNREYMVKVVEQEGLHPLDQAALLTEVRLHQAFPTHDHVGRLHGSFDEAGVMKLIMDACLGGNLSAQIYYLKCYRIDFALSDRAAATVTRQLLSALSFCHFHGVVHRDVQPGNVWLMHPVKQVPLESSSACVKLCDFGCATQCSLEDPPALRELVGCLEYMAPEVARRQDYGCAVDVWSAGVVLFECLRGRMPFNGETEEEFLLDLDRKADWPFDWGWLEISDEAMSCVQLLLREEVQHRPHAAQALGHQWLCEL